MFLTILHYQVFLKYVHLYFYSIFMFLAYQLQNWTHRYKCNNTSWFFKELAHFSLMTVHKHRNM
jgi:hypothetical protein